MHCIAGPIRGADVAYPSTGATWDRRGARPSRSVVAVSGLAVASGAQAQQATPRVTIAARYPTALQGIDPLVYEVTRAGAVDESWTSR